VSSRAANIPTAAASWTNSPNLFFIIRFLYRPLPRSTFVHCPISDGWFHCW
jgi:hypothetical protein